ncbi:MAG TPA: MFS transporter [Candidatus Acidoferrales bacterium]|jgi:MFS family permease|nr:MFS transporter [Candidatus Acidoferrales bacterium]
MARETEFYGWKLLAVFWIILFANFAFPLYGASVVNTYMAESLHWDRTQLGTAYAIYQLMIGAPAPLVAILIARKGVRFTAALGCGVVVAGALLMSFVVRTSFQTDLVYGVMIGLGAMTGGVLVAQTGINRWFSKHKGLAITLVHTGGTLGGFVAARVLDKMIRAFGGNWRAGWWLIAGVSTICAVLAMLFVRERPADLGQFPDGATAQEAAAYVRSEANERVHKTNEDWALLDVLRTPSIWLILVSLLGFSAGYPLYIAHGNAHLRDLGYSPAQAASSISIMLLCAMFGTLFFAAIADRIEPRLSWAIGSVVFAAGMLLALHASGAAGLYLYAVLLGGSFGVCFSAMMVLPANYYGVKGYPGVISFMMVVGTTAGFLGATLAGIVFDRYHSYTPVFYCVAALSVLAAIVLLLMKPARKPAGSVAVTAAEHA